MMLYELDPVEKALLGPPVAPPTVATLRLRKRTDPLPSWYNRKIVDNHLLREESQGPAICVSCGTGTWMELHGEPACHECVDRLRFAGYPLGFRQSIKKGDYYV